MTDEQKAQLAGLIEQWSRAESEQLKLSKQAAEKMQAANELRCKIAEVCGGAKEGPIHVRSNGLWRLERTAYGDAVYVTKLDVTEL